MVGLRRLVPWDTSRIAELLNNRNIWDQLRDSIPFPYSESDAENYLSFIENDKSQVVYGVECSGVLVGIVGLILQTDIYRFSAELGYWLGEEYWGRGIMPQIVREIVQIGFKEYNLLRIFSGVLEHNKRSMRVLEKSGFMLEAILKKAVIKNGVIQDEYRYVLLNDGFNSEVKVCR